MAESDEKPTALGAEENLESPPAKKVVEIPDSAESSDSQAESLSRKPPVVGSSDRGDKLLVVPDHVDRLKTLAQEHVTLIHERSRDLENRLETLTKALSKTECPTRVKEITAELNTLRLEAVYGLVRLEGEQWLGEQFAPSTPAANPKSRRVPGPPLGGGYPGTSFPGVAFPGAVSPVRGGFTVGGSALPSRGVTISASSPDVRGPDEGNRSSEESQLSPSGVTNLLGENRALRLRISQLMAEQNRGAKQRSRGHPAARPAATPHRTIAERDGGTERSHPLDRGEARGPRHGASSVPPSGGGVAPTPAPSARALLRAAPIARLPRTPTPMPALPSLPVEDPQNVDLPPGWAAEGGRGDNGFPGATEPALSRHGVFSERRGSRSQPPSGARPRLQEIQIKAFEGSEGDCFRDWRETEWQPYFEYMRLDEIQPRMRAFLLRSKLGKRARQYLDSKASRDGPQTYEHILELLELRYSPQAIRNAMKLKFQNRDREASEPIDVYLDDLGYLYLQSHVEMGTRESEIAVIERALNGIDPEMAAKIDEMWAVVPEENRTTDALIQAVQHLELKKAAAAAQTNLQRRQQSLSLTRGGSNPSLSSNASSVPSQAGGPNRRYDNANRPGFYSNQRVPPRPPAETGATPIAPVSAASGGEPPVVSVAAPPVENARPKPTPGYTGCFICKGLDHYARDCGVRNEVKFISSLDPGSLCNESCAASCVGHLVCAACGRFGHTSGACAQPANSGLSASDHSGNA